MPLDSITKAGLFARLARPDGEGGRTTVLTPNRRLAHSLSAEFDAVQSAAGLSAWPAADILPFGSFLARVCDEARYLDDAPAMPLILEAEQELVLWEEAIRQSEAGRDLLAVAQAASLARDAWMLAHEWQFVERLASAARDDDSQAFLRWSRVYEARLRRAGCSDAARLPVLARSLLEERRVVPPECIVLAGFDVTTPRQRGLIEALERAGIAMLELQPAAASPAARRVQCLDARDEVRRAAAWARARLAENPAARIAIVVPELERQRHSLRRALRDALAPGEPAAAPFNISLGEKLSSWPIVAHALLLLALCGREIEATKIGLLVRSPFLAAAEQERDARARLDAALRRRAEPEMTLERLVELCAGESMPRAPLLEERLAALAVFRRERLFGAQSPREWAKAFGEALSAAGFPGERTLDSHEYQTLARWHELLAQFARLERVASRFGFAEALSRLDRLASASPFQPESGSAPVQVLGVLEAAGLAFDHLRVIGLSEEAWPLNPPANPFLPFALQREAGIPNASPEATLALARRLTDGWLAGAPEVLLSHPAREADRPLGPSPLIAVVAPVESGEPPLSDASWRNAIHASASLEPIKESPVPLAQGVLPGGGSGLLRDQAACAFRAFARHRLGADALEDVEPGLDARDRGTLVHRVLAAAWRQLQTKDALDVMPSTALQHFLEGIAARELERQRPERPRTLAGRYAAIEAARLARLAAAWLEHERERGPFSVVAIEEKRALDLGGLTINVRLDRVDETPEGRVVIDYKTGDTKLGSMLGPRPEEPQLPLYAAVAEPESIAAAFAQLGAGRARFVGLADREGLLPSVKTPGQSARSGAASDWPAQRAFWRDELARLAREFAEGRAEAEPKRYPGTCQYCELGALCRIREQRDTAKDDADAA